MKLRVVPRGQSLIAEVCASLLEDGRDFSASLVVFPGKRPAHFLRRALAEAVGTGFIPPKVLSMDEFIDESFERFDQRRKIENMDAVALLYRIHRKTPKRLGGEGFMTPDSFFPLGVRIFRDIEELTIEGIGRGMVREVGSFIEGGLPEQTGDRLQSLSWFYEGFYPEASAAGFSTRSERYAAVAEKAGRAGPDNYRQAIFAGFFAFTKAERDLFLRLLAEDNTRFFFQEGAGLGAQLAALGLSHEAPDDAHEPEVHFYSSPDTHGQVLALGSVLCSLAGERELDEKTVVVLPSSETLFPLMRQGLSALDDDTYNISLGYPLLRTPVFGFLNNLMELVASMDGDRVYVPDYLKFVLHPYTKNIYYEGRAETTRILFHTVEEQLLTQRMRTFVTLAEIEENSLLCESAIRKLPAGEKGVVPELLRDHLRLIHRNTVGRFLSFRDIGDFAGQCMDVVIYVSNNSTARLHPLFYPFSESFISNLDQMGRSLMRDISFAETSSYFTFFRRSMAACHMPFPGTPVKGLQVLGLLETRNLMFDRVFVLDANEEVLPDTWKEETLLPFAVREKLGLPTYIDRDRLAAYYFDSLTGSAKEVSLFFIENDRKERSRFVEKLLWARQKKELTTDARAFIRPLHYAVELANRSPEAIGKTDEMAAFLKGFRFSATALNEYLSCPLRFYYSKVLRLDRRDEITGDIERVDVGKFVHEVLKEFFGELKGRELREADIDFSRMDRIIDRLFTAAYGGDISGAVFLLRRQVKRQMAELLKNYYLPLVSGSRVTVIDTERPVEVIVGGFRLKGRLDSIEERDGRTVIIDFKTGSNEAPLKTAIEKLDPDKRETWDRAIGSLQLPFYILLYAEKEGLPAEELEALFLLLGRSGISREIELPLFGSESPDQIFGPLRKVIFGLMEEIIDPQMPFLPPSDLRRACPGCDFPSLCATRWV